MSAEIVQLRTPAEVARLIRFRKATESLIALNELIDDQLNPLIALFKEAGPADTLRVRAAVVWLGEEVRRLPTTEAGIADDKEAQAKLIDMAIRTGGLE